MPSCNILWVTQDWLLPAEFYLPLLDANAHSPSTRVGVSRGRGRSQVRPTPVSSTARSAVMALHQMGPAHQCSLRPV